MQGGKRDNEDDTYLPIFYLYSFILITEFCVNVFGVHHTFWVGVDGVEPMLGRGMLLTNSYTPRIFWSEIFTWIKGSSPDILNLGNGRT